MTPFPIAAASSACSFGICASEEATRSLPNLRVGVGREARCEKKVSATSATWLETCCERHAALTPQQAR